MKSKQLFGGRSGSIALCLIAVYSILICFSVIMSETFIHDDNMYIAAGILLSEKQIYSDFSYLQTPYMPYLYNLVFSLNDYSHPLLVGKLLKFILSTIEVILLYLLFRFLSGNKWISASFILIVVNNRIFRSIIPYIRNYDLALILALSAFLFYFYRRGRSTGRQWLTYLITGMLTGAAIGVKLTFGLVPLCFLIPLFIEYRSSTKGWQLFASFISGMVLFLLPAIIITVRPGFDIGYFNNIGYHSLNVAWVMTEVSESSVYFHEKLLYFLNIFTCVRSNIFLLILFIYAILVSAKEKISVKYSNSPYPVVLLFLFVGVLMFFLPTPSGEGYLYAAIPAFLMLICILYRKFSDTEKKRISILSWAVAVVLILGNGALDLKMINTAFIPSAWGPNKMHESIQTLADYIPEDQRNQPVATLHSAIPLEVGMDIYPEFSSGEFTCRIAHILSGTELDRYGISAPRFISSLLEENPPSAIIVKVDIARWEVPFMEYAETHGYEDFYTLDEYIFYIKTVGAE
ncbi:MAG: hypothetical protein H8D05_00715 [FCB group bacterium]|nr:hypothetical protein [FCB group bacterium]